MILRRFMQHVKDQNWFAVGLDVIVVIVGIFLGMQVQQWYEAQKENEFEQTVLIELQQAIQSDIEYFEDHLLNSRNQRKREAIQYFSDMIEGKDIDTDQFRGHFFWLKWPNGFQLNDGAYESIKSSGINKISNSELRRLLTKSYEFDIPRRAEFIKLSFIELQKVAERELPYLLQDPVPEINEEGLDIEEYPIEFDVRSNPHFLRLLDQSMRSEQTSSRSYKSIVRILRELDELITNELISS